MLTMFQCITIAGGGCLTDSQQNEIFELAKRIFSKYYSALAGKDKTKL